MCVPASPVLPLVLDLLKTALHDSLSSPHFSVLPERSSVPESSPEGASVTEFSLGSCIRPREGFRSQDRPKEGSCF